MSEVYLKFGKHKGERLQDVPLKYLGWLLLKYEGGSLSRKDIEAEALRRGCRLHEGKWQYPAISMRSGFDVYGEGYGLMAGVTEIWNEDASCAEDQYSYEGIPNFD